MNANIETRRLITPVASHDLLIREQIMTAFQESGYHRLCRVRCQVDDGIVDLEGQVSTFHLKQVAQVLALRHGQVRRVHNNIQVA